MSPRLRRLVSLLSLAAFVMANLPARVSACSRTHAAASDPCGACERSAACRHCHAEHGAACDHRDCPQETPAVASQTSPDAHRGGPSCPCCPCPSGCAYCNVAKVLGEVPPAAAPERDRCLGWTAVAATPLSLSAYCGKLIRPPRA